MLNHKHRIYSLQEKIAPRRHPAWLIILFLAISIASLFAANGLEKNTTPHDPILLKIPVWVRNGNGFEAGWRLEDFHLSDGKAPLPLVSLQRPEAPTLLFIAFDTVGEVSAITEMHTALKAELKKLGPQYRVGLLSAHEIFKVIQDPTADFSMLEQKIDTLTQNGKAGLLDNIQTVSEFSSQILHKTQVRVAVLFITDSDIGNYRTNYLNPTVNYSDNRDLSRRFPGRALQEKISRMTLTLARTQIPIFILHIDPGQDPLNKIYQDGLKQIAETLGGQLFLSKTVNDVPLMVQSAFAWIRSFYLLGFQATKGKNEQLKIQITPTRDAAASPGIIKLAYPSHVSLP
jgi:hypothetical protein